MWHTDQATVMSRKGEEDAYLSVVYSRVTARWNDKSPDTPIRLVP